MRDFKLLKKLLNNFNFVFYLNNETFINNEFFIIIYFDNINIDIK